MTQASIPLISHRTLRASAGHGTPAASGTRLRSAALWLCMTGLATASLTTTRLAGWTISDLSFLAAGCVIVLKLLNGRDKDLAPRRIRQGSPLIFVGTMVLLTAGTMSTLNSINAISSLTVLARLAWITLVWFWILRSVCRDRAAFQSLVTAWKATLVVSAGAAVLGEFGIAFTTDGTSGRQQAFTDHPGDLMNFLAVGLFVFAVPLLRPELTDRHRARTTAWNAAATALVALGIFATGSMSGLVAVAGGAAAVLVVLLTTRTPSGRRRRGRSPLATMALLAGVAVGLLLIFSSDLPVVERLNDYLRGDTYVNASVSFRDRTNQEIIDDLDRFLLVGIGPEPPGRNAAFGASSIDTTTLGYNRVHNMHLKMLSETGLPGLVGLWIIIFAAGRQAFRTAHACRGTDLFPIALALVGGFVASNVSAMFGPVAFGRFFWLPFALVGCLAALRRDELTSGLEAAAPAARDGTSTP